MYDDVCALVEYPQMSAEATSPIGHLFWRDPLDWQNPTHSFAYSLGSPSGQTHKGKHVYCKLLVGHNGNLVPCIESHYICMCCLTAGFDGPCSVLKKYFRSRKQSLSKGRSQRDGTRTCSCYSTRCSVLASSWLGNCHQHSLANLQHIPENCSSNFGTAKHWMSCPGMWAYTSHRRGVQMSKLAFGRTREILSRIPATPEMVWRPIITWVQWSS